jgi:hypothetical protein
MNNQVNVWHWREDILRHNSKEDILTHCSILCEAYDMCFYLGDLTKEAAADKLIEITLEINGKHPQVFNAFNMLKIIAKA